MALAGIAAYGLCGCVARDRHRALALGIFVAALAVLSDRSAALLGLTGGVSPLANFRTFAVGMLVAVLVASGYRPRPLVRLVVGLATALLLPAGVYLYAGGEAGHLLVLAGCGGLLAIVALGTPGGLWRRICTVAPLRFLGAISYSLYLWHQPILELLGFLFRPDAGAFIANLALLLAISIPVASVSYAAFERPAIRIRRRERQIRGDVAEQSAHAQRLTAG
jgi:peptidoglycan/LPS O-acetylase OafA/YrhL